jgi:hypothetical protein
MYILSLCDASVILLCNVNGFPGGGGDDSCCLQGLNYKQHMASGIIAVAWLKAGHVLHIASYRYT